MKWTSHSSKMEEECDETEQIVLKNVYGSRGHAVCENKKFCIECDTAIRRQETEDVQPHVQNERTGHVVPSKERLSELLG
jgi:hypothetical protein